MLPPTVSPSSVKISSNRRKNQNSNVPNNPNNAETSEKREPSVGLANTNISPSGRDDLDNVVEVQDTADGDTGDSYTPSLSSGSGKIPESKLCTFIPATF